MGGIRVDADTQASTDAGLLPPANVLPESTAQIVSVAIPLSDLLVFGERGGEYAPKFAQENDFGTVNNEQMEEKVKWTLKGFDSKGGENPYQIQSDLQEMMQDLVGIVRNEEEMQRALEGIEKLKERRENISVTGNIDFNPGWHTALDLHNLLNVGSDYTAAIQRKESRGGQFREDYPEKVSEYGKINFVIKRGMTDK